MASYLDLLKRLPKTNCKECGVESCLLFALKVSSGEMDTAKCPYLPPLPKEEKPPSRLTFDQLRENLQDLKVRLKELNLKELAYPLGAQVLGREIRLDYLDEVIIFEVDENFRFLNLRAQGDKELDPRDEILLMNYFLFKGKEIPRGNFVGLEAFPHSISKIKTLKRYAEDPLARLFEEKRDKVLSALSRFKVSELKESSSGISLLLYALPRVPLFITYWAGDPEDNLEPSSKILYDEKAIHFLDLECLVFLAERFVEKLSFLLL